MRGREIAPRLASRTLGVGYVVAPMGAHPHREFRLVFPEPRAPSLARGSRRDRRAAGMRVAVRIALAQLALLAPVASWGQAAMQWSGPTVIAEANTVWTRPTILADARGHVHVLWTDRDATGQAGKAQKGEALYHAQWDGRQWSAPAQVVSKPAHAFCFVFVDATVGSDDEIYAVWSEQSALYFSRAPTVTAHDPRSWVPPRRVVQATMVDQSRIVRGPAGRLHVIYARLASDDGPAGNLFYVASNDGGDTWSAPLQLSRVGVQEPPVVSVPRLVIDGTGGLHAAWDEPAPPNWISRRILYARSQDGGRTWTEPMAMSAAAEGNHNTSPSLVTTGRNTVHLVWGCVGPPTRCYRVSVDGGKDWSPTQRIFPEFVSMAGWDALVADARANLHLVAQLRMPYGMYSAFKPADGAWQRPVRFVGEQAFEDGHFVSAVAVGMDVHAVWQKGPGIGDVTYARMTQAPKGEARAAQNPPGDAPP